MSLAQENSERFGKPLHPVMDYPSPFLPTWQSKDFPIEVDSRRWIKQLRMRSQIRAAARTEMAQEGFEGVQLRTIANTCGISVQTIYNLIGDRPQVLQQASEEWVTILERAAVAHAAEADISDVLAIVGTFWASPLYHSNYVSNTARVARTREAPLNQTFRSTAIKAVQKTLIALRQRGLLRPWVSEACLARQLVSNVHSGIYEWTVERFDVGTYWREFENGPLLMILSAVTGGELARIENGMERIRNQTFEQIGRLVSGHGSAH